MVFTRKHIFVLTIAVLIFIISSNFCEGKFNKISKDQGKYLKRHCGLTPKFRGRGQKILFGRRAKSFQFPSMVGISAGRKQLCGGTLITSRHVLTAAHCVHSTWEGCDTCSCDVTRIRRATDFHVHIGSTVERQGYKIGVKKLVEPRRWTRSGDCFRNGGDIAILELKTDVPKSQLKKGVGFACLPFAKDPYGNGRPKHVFACGFGHTFGTAEREDVLLWTKLKPMSSKKCHKQQNEYDFAADTICTREIKSNVCGGDSGGPLLSKGRKGRQKIMGIVSHGTDCSDMLDPGNRETFHGGFFTDVRRYLRWICRLTGACYTTRKRIHH